MGRSLILAAASCLLSQAAWAHAFLERSDPPVGSELPATPAAVTITFTEAVEPSFSTIEVRDSAGTRVDKSDPHIAGGDGTKLSVSLPKLSAGNYIVIWHVTSVDTHQTEGHFNFRILP